MPFRIPLQTVALSHPKDLKTLVEHRTAYTLNACELNIFETYTTSNLVPLTFNDLVVTSMLKGKKVMHLFEEPGFDYLPGETVVVPANETMHIDFPEAADVNPTQCIALAIDAARINQTLDTLNERYPKEGNHHFWQLDFKDYHFNNDEALTAHINKMIGICSGHYTNKDILADLALQELIVRLAQQQHLKTSKSNNTLQYDHPLYYVTQFIREHISEKFKLEDLYKMACMSKVTFYRSFKREFGISPIEYILHERIRRAKQLLALQNTSISDVCYELGFMDTNYFHRQFKKTEGITPKQFKLLTIPANGCR
jgi:AraC-like DNA-binding protein